MSVLWDHATRLTSLQAETIVSQSKSLSFRMLGTDQWVPAMEPINYNCTKSKPKYRVVVLAFPHSYCYFFCSIGFSTVGDVLLILVVSAIAPGDTVSTFSPMDPPCCHRHRTRQALVRLRHRRPIWATCRHAWQVRYRSLGLTLCLESRMDSWRMALQTSCTPPTCGRRRSWKLR